MKKGQTYSTKQIEDYAENNNYDLNDYGRNIIGEGFLVLKHMEKDIAISFVLTSASTNTYMYECIYTDI